MSLGPDNSWCLPGDWPRHKLRAYGRIAGVPGGAEYRRLLNFLSKHASQGERELLNITPVPRFAQVPLIVNRRIRSASDISSNFANRLKAADVGSSGSWSVEPVPAPHSVQLPIQELLNEPMPQPLNQLREPPQFELPMMPAAFANHTSVIDRGANEAGYINFAPDAEVDLTITFDESPVNGSGVGRADIGIDYSVCVEEAMQTDFSVSTSVSLTGDDGACNAPLQEPLLHADVPANIVERVAEVQNEDGQFLSHLSVLLNEWFDKENIDSHEDAEPAPKGLESPEKRRERTYALLKKTAADKLESKRLIDRLGEASANENPAANGGGKRSSRQSDERSESRGPCQNDERSKSRSGRNAKIAGPSFIDPSLTGFTQTDRNAGPVSRVGGSANSGRMPGTTEGLTQGTTESRRRARSRERHEVSRQVSFLPNGMRKEECGDGSFVLKDAVGRVIEARSHDGAIMSFSYDNRGHLKSFVRSDVSGKIHTTGVKDRHGVVVRDEHGSLRAQGDSMAVDTNGCVSIRKFDGQFWSLDVLRGIHIERRILEDVNGNWNCLTALLTCDGFRMVTRFQKLQESKRESYRKYGDWLGSAECSRFRFYGRDGSMIQFENDEDLESLRPSRIWSAGSRSVDREWVGRRQAGTAWEAVHRYISQYLSAL